MINGNILPHLDRVAIEAAYRGAPGNEVASGKFLSPQSSAALTANAFGLFLSEPDLAPPLPRLEDLGWPALRIFLEAEVQFPWAGGRHPCLDLVVETRTAIIGIESKRYEPFRSKATGGFSRAFWRRGWGDQMDGYQKIRDQLNDGALKFDHLDAAQLVKHALGLRHTANREGRIPVLAYVYAEPDAWPDGRPVPHEQIMRHRQEIDFFRMRTRSDEVRFVAISYGQLLASWRGSADAHVRDHAEAVRQHFTVPDSGGAPSFEPLWRSDELLGAETA